MKKLEDFYCLKSESEDPHHYTKQVATIVGLQPHSELWVFNGQVHMNADRDLVDPKTSPFIWLGDYVSDSVLHKHSLPTSKEASTVPASLDPSQFHSLLEALENVYQHNIPAATLMIGAEVLAVHYSLLQDIGIQVPAAIAVGNVSLGKTRSAEAALSLVGMDTVSKVKSITDVKAIKFGSLTSLGMIIDDPSHPSEVSEKLLFHFDRGTRATTTSFDAPKTTFLTSMNTTCLQALSSMDPRYYDFPSFHI